MRALKCVSWPLRSVDLNEPMTGAGAGGKQDPGVLKKYRLLIILAVTAMALYFRLFPSEAYFYYYYHPDESTMLASVTEYPNKQLVKHYGPLPLYLGGLYRSAAAAVCRALNISQGALYPSGLRVITGIIDAGTVIFTFLFTELIMGTGAGLLAALLLAFTVYNIQLAHFFTLDTYMTFFLAGAFYFYARAYLKAGALNFILGGIFFGAALTSKITCLPFVAVPVFAAFFGASKDRPAGVLKALAAGFAAIAAAVAVFNPPLILGAAEYAANLRKESFYMLTRHSDLYFLRQFIGRTPFFYAENLMFYGMGIPYFLLFAGGVVFCLLRAAGKHAEKRITTMMLLWTAAYLALLSIAFAKFYRYLLPLTPFAASFAAIFAFGISRKLPGAALRAALPVLAAASACFYAVAFLNVYRNPHPWKSAVEWIGSNMPEKINNAAPMVLIEGVERSIEGQPYNFFCSLVAERKKENISFLPLWNGVAMKGEEGLSEAEADAGRISSSDYIAISDSRWAATYGRLEKEFPVHHNFYRVLLSNPAEFGFEKAADISVYPSFLGITIKDDAAEYMFQYIDHPHVYIFRKTGKVPADKIAGMLAGKK